MPKPADIGSKRLISLAPDIWVRWATQIPDIVAREVISSEFQWLSRESDVLVKAFSPQYGEFLVLNELQLRYKSNMPKRMRAYAALAEEKENLPTLPVLINILREGNVEIPTRYESEFAGLQARQDYRVINMWEVDVEIAFTDAFSPLLPFVPVLKGGAKESTVQSALRVLRADERLRDFEAVMAFFASFVLESSVVRQIMRWDMAVLQESPWYQEILNTGVQQGVLSGIELALELKFATSGLELLPAISQVSDLERLKAIQRAVLTVNTLEELRRLL